MPSPACLMYSAAQEISLCSRHILLLRRYLFAVACAQMNFLSVAFGHSGSRYSGKTLAAAHGHLIREHSLCEAQFDAMIRHLADTLDALGKEQELVDEVMAVIGQYRCVFQAQGCS